MPKWYDPPEAGLKDSLRELWNELNEEVVDNPRFDEVTGLTQEQLSRHAMEAIAAFAKNSSEDTGFGDPLTMMQLYICGFVVGMKYGERRHKSPSPPE